MKYNQGKNKPVKRKSQNKARIESNNEPNSDPKNDFINKMGKKSLLNRLHKAVTEGSLRTNLN
jgi:hypothetical protein